VSKLMTDGVCK